MNKRLFGLIGYPLGHSFSKKYFTEKFEQAKITDAEYELFPLEQIADFPDLLRRYPALRGLNVTIPHKSEVIPFLTRLDDTATAVGAVNCIRFEPDGSLTGFNTDVIGFEQSLRRFLANAGAAPDQLSGLVLGTGGSSRAVAYVLKKLGIGFVQVSRQPGEGQIIRYEDIEAYWHNERPKRALVVNTTPLGMHPHTEACAPIPFHALLQTDLLFDLVYNPAETLLLQRAKSHGCATCNGLEMLHLQAEAAWTIWNSGHELPMPPSGK